MVKIQTFYDNLKVARDAPDVVICAAYKALMQLYHPEKFEGHEDEALRKAVAIRESYDALIDSNKRAEHDLWIEEQESNAKQHNCQKQFRGIASDTIQDNYQQVTLIKCQKSVSSSENVILKTKKPSIFRQFFTYSFDYVIVSIILLILFFSLLNSRTIHELLPITQASEALSVVKDLPKRLEKRVLNISIPNG